MTGTGAKATITNSNSNLDGSKLSTETQAYATGFIGVAE